MPKGMSQLKNLQFLSNYVVGKREENKMTELGALADLQQSISIAGLENVVNSSEASMARMFDKDGICSLQLSCYCEKLVSTAAFMNSQFQGLIHLRIEGECESVKCLPKEDKGQFSFGAREYFLCQGLVVDLLPPLARFYYNTDCFFFCSIDKMIKSTVGKVYSIPLKDTAHEIEAADKQRRECSDIGITIGATI
ncbi:hypothetical protein AHAS_Ahas02G0257600 [Arachis hypogaea]